MGVRVVIKPVSLDTAGHMDVGQAVQRQSIQESDRVPAVIAGIRVNVFDVEQQQDIRLFQHLGQELGLVQLGIRSLEQGGDVLEGERHGQGRLGLPDVGHHDLQGFPGTRQRQQVPRLDAPGPHESQVFADQRSA